MSPRRSAESMTVMMPAAMIPAEVTRHVVELACTAPSIGNSQPWWWRAERDAVELHLDLTTLPAAVDPHGRQRVISCGVALQHAQVAARALGRHAVVHRLPDRTRPTLLAVLELEGDGEADPSELAVMADRFTDRRRFTSWPVPADLLAWLGTAAAEHGSHGTALDLVHRYRFERLFDRSTTPGHVAAEDDVWGSDGLIVLGSDEDDTLSWLRAGEGLSALWLRATRAGLAIVPLSWPIESPGDRESLRREVLESDVLPLLVLRICWQQLGRGRLVRTTRRPLAEVLRP